MEKVELCQIYPKRFFGEIKGDEFYVVKVEKKLTGKLLKLIKEEFPKIYECEFKHLKRVKSLQSSKFNLIFLGKVEKIDEETLSNLQNKLEINENQIIKMELPIWIPPFKLEEYMKSKKNEKKWPIIVKENTLKSYKEPLILDSLPEEIKQYLDFKEDEWTCFIFDPKEKKIKAMAKIEMSDHQSTSIDHPVMKALENFGSLLNSLEGKNPDLGKREEPEEPKGGYYICKDMWVLASHEPCIMCSMALTHSRISKLIFKKQLENSKLEYLQGGCNSTVQVFCDPRLNHRYKVYKI